MSITLTTSTPKTMHRHLLAALACVLLVGCAASDATSTNGTVRPGAAVTVTVPKIVWAPPGQPVTVSAIVTDAAGMEVPDAQVRWSVSDSTVARIVSSAPPSGTPPRASAVVVGLKVGLTTFLTATLTSGVASGAAAVRTARAVSVYDLTTQFATFAWELPNGDGVNCPQTTQNCVVRKPFTGASLTGTVSYDRTRDTVSAQFGGAFCSSWSTAAPSGCTAVVGVPSAPYHVYGTVTNSGEPFASPLQAPGDFGSVVLFANVVTTADSTYGDIIWQQSPGRFPPQHAGRFVARERR